MIIELKGVEFVNKGAELMLLSILNKLSKDLPEAKFVMVLRPGGKVPKEKLLNLNIGVKHRLVKRGIDFSFLANFLPKSYRRSKDFYLDKEVDVILDGSGFAFGDFWGPVYAHNRLGVDLPKIKKNNQMLIFLPQAFGPFEKAEMALEIKKLVDAATLVFARDSYSYDSLMNLDMPKKQHIKQRPDFTNIISGVHLEKHAHLKGKVAIIPNNKLLESKVFATRDEHVQFLLFLVGEVIENNKIPFFLIHEGKKDLELCAEVNKLLDVPIEMVVEDDPLAVKGIIGDVYATITSRFHGLVSSFSQAVPSLCIGWSHKYKALCEDYGMEDFLIKDQDLQQRKVLAQHVSSLLEPKNQIQLVEILKQSAKIQKEETLKMWAEVVELIKSKHK